MRLRVRFSPWLLLLGALVCRTTLGQAVISTEIISGDPCKAGELEIALVVSRNTETLGTYAFFVSWPEGVKYVNMRDAEFGAAPLGVEAGNGVRLSAFSATSTFTNGRLAVITVSNPGTVGGEIVPDKYGATPFASTSFAAIDHVYRSNARLPCGSQPTATPTPTQPVPTDTPDPASIAATATAMAPTPKCRIEARLSEGDPRNPGPFSLTVGIQGNDGRPIGSYAVSLAWNPQFRFVAARDASGGLGMEPTVVGEGNRRNIAAYNIRSTLQNGGFFVLTLDSPGVTEGVENVLLALDDYGPTPLLDTNVEMIEHGFSIAAVTMGAQSGAFAANLPAGTDPNQPAGAGGPGAVHTPISIRSLPTRDRGSHDTNPEETPVQPDQTPATPVATQTAFATITPTATRSGEVAIIDAVLLDNPCQGGNVRIAVRISNNSRTVGTYAFTVQWNRAFTYVGIADGDFGAAPTSSEVGSGFEISAFNALSRLTNGTLFVLTLRAPGGNVVDVIEYLDDYGPTPLVGTDFQPIEHIYNDGLDDNPCRGGATSTPALGSRTPVTSETPGAATPTSDPDDGFGATRTPTSSPTRTPTAVRTTDRSETPTARPTATATDGGIGGQDARIEAVLAGDACGTAPFPVEFWISRCARPVGSYAFTVTWDSALEFVGVAAGGFGTAPVPAGTGNRRNLSAFNATSTLKEGVLFVLRLQRKAGAGVPADVIISMEDYGPTPLVTTDFVAIPHVFIATLDDSPCGVPVASATPTATRTMPLVTETPTIAPASNVCLAADVNNDCLVDAVDLLLVLDGVQQGYFREADLFCVQEQQGIELCPPVQGDTPVGLPAQLYGYCEPRNPEVGSTFLYVVALVGGEQARGIQFDMVYDPYLLEVSDVRLHTDLDELGANVFAIVGDGSGNAVRSATVLLTEAAANFGDRGLLEITFTRKSGGVSPVRFERVTLVGSDYSRLPVNAETGRIPSN